MNETSDMGVVHFQEIEVGASRQVGISVLTSDNVRQCQVRASGRSKAALARNLCSAAALTNQHHVLKGVILSWKSVASSRRLGSGRRVGASPDVAGRAHPREIRPRLGPVSPLSTTIALRE